MTISTILILANANFKNKQSLIPDKHYFYNTKLYILEMKTCTRFTDYLFHEEHFTQLSRLSEI